MKVRIGAWLFLLCSVLLFTAMVFVVGDYLRNQRITREMRSSLHRVDRLIADQRYRDAEITLRRAAQHAGSTSAWIRLIKRSWDIAAVTDRYNTFAEIAVSAAADLSGNRELQALALFGELKLGDYVDAARRADSHLATESRYRSLVAEAFLRAGRRLEDAEHDDIAALTLLGRSSSAQQFFAAAELTGDSRFETNAVARAMEEGDRATAVERIGDARFYRRFPLMAAVVAFDTGDTARFFEYLRLVDDSSVADNQILLMTADIYMTDGRYDDALRLYEEISETVRPADRSVVPELYLNRAWIAGQRTEYEESARILRRGLELHPDHWELRRALVLDLEPYDRAAARQLLGDAPPDLSATVELLDERLFSPSRQVSANVARLWVLHEQYPDDQTISRFLAWFLAGLPGSKELNMLLEQQGRSDSDWVAFYRAVSAVEAQDLDTAYRLFARSARDDGNRHAAMNAARIALQLGGSTRLNEASDLVDLARVLNATRPSTDRDRATVEALHAAILADAGEYAAATKVARQAVEIDGGNQQARAVLRYLETR